MSEHDDLLRRATSGDERALAALFTTFRERLKRIVRLRLDRRLSGRVDASDVVQEAYLDVHRRFPEWVCDQQLPFFLWLRLVTGQKLLDFHRHHLGTQMRDVGQAPVSSLAAEPLLEPHRAYADLLPARSRGRP